MFWEATRTSLAERWPASSASAVAGGQMTTSAAPSSAAGPANSSAKAIASARVLFIFQFAATRGRRFESGIVEGLHSR